MKTFSRTTLTVITAIGVVCVATALVFGKPGRAPQREKFPYQLTMRCILKTQKLLDGISHVPNAQKKIQIDGVPKPGNLVVPAESPCTLDGRPNSNVTQRVAFATSDKLKDFINNAFP